MLANASLVIITLLQCSLLSLTYLHFYPVFHGCRFPYPSSSPSTNTGFWDQLHQHGHWPFHSAKYAAPFRLLALGDPQLEGDTSMPDTTDGYFSSLTTVREFLAQEDSVQDKIRSLQDFQYSSILEDLKLLFATWRKRLDLLGNDYYLAHIYRTMHRHAKPTHVAVLGDLVGSQWIDDEEFDWRGHRFWNRVFRHGLKVDEGKMVEPSIEMLGEDKSWDKRIVSIVGNHDVGYAGDMDKERVARFERTYGELNWEIRFHLPVEHLKITNTSMINHELPELRIIVLNSMNLDTPAQDPDLQTETYAFINQVIRHSKPVETRNTGTILLTHIPLHKEEGTCVDSPFFDFYPQEEGGGLREQNQISYNAGKGILEGIYGMSADPRAPGKGLGRNGIILTGHDHEGCDVYHHLLPASSSEDPEARRWHAMRWKDAAEVRKQPDVPGLREITVRSMMGDFGGNAGLLSAWFDEGVGEWQFEYSTCSIGVQHIWWAIHVLFLVSVGVASLAVLRSWLRPWDTPFVGERKESGVMDQDCELTRRK